MSSGGAGPLSPSPGGCAQCASPWPPALASACWSPAPLLFAVRGPWVPGRTLLTKGTSEEERGRGEGGVRKGVKGDDKGWSKKEVGVGEKGDRGERGWIVLLMSFENVGRIIPR